MSKKTPKRNGDNERLDVGYGKPPQATQFKKGQSGNPKGRPKGYKNLKTDLIEELDELVMVTEGGTRKAMRKQRAMIKGQMSRALERDTRAAKTILELIFRVLKTDEVEESIEELNEEDEAIIKNFTARMSRNKKGNPE